VASLLHRVDFIEKMGTGIGRIQEALAENGNEPAQFQTGDFFTVSFNRPKKLAATIQETSVKTSGKTSGKILEMITKDSTITIPQMAEKLGKTSRNIEMHISNLKKKGKIKRIGSAKGGHWQVLD
jgi:ATP-dependent DNA helicase RecG